ncbi:polysaccharide deacetylase family protein [Marinibacterium sp. SX1]|uniref:polysaccharide deacetylase family protein n=1 Tax=Marinibacterium sp. SX1 TaxID=3388424 RepID=UPI003D171765
MSPDWRPLEAELDRLDAPLPVWWRDDDAVRDTPALDRLIGLAEGTGWPLHLAVIPAHAEASLAARLARAPGVVAVTHGMAHANHAPEGSKKAEFGAHRPVAEMAAEAGAARARLADLLGAEPAPMFVPPWNRVAPDLLPMLPDAGFAMISTFTPRDAPRAAPGLWRVNTHLDPIDWRGSRSLVDPDRLIAQMARDLADRRTGRTDPDEPYGLLTHHLVHDDPIRDFVAALLTCLSRAPLVHWTARDTPEPECRP